MGKIDELIKQLCQCGVKRAKLVDYAKVQYGFAFNSKLFTEDSANIPLIRIRDVIPGKPSTYYLGEYSDEYIVKKGDILVGMDGNFNLEKWNDRNGLLNQRVCKIFTKDAGMLLDVFLYHYLKPVFKKIENSIQGSTVKHLSAKVINGIEIPLPPLAVQKKIVEILDTFTGMIGNLQKELEQRQKQFEHYRDQLLTFKEDECKYSKLADVCEVINGRAYKQSELLSDGKYRVLRVGNFFSNDSWYYSNLELDDKNYCQKGDLLYAWSASFGPRIWKEEKVVFHYHIWKMACSDGLDRVFFYYWLQSHDMERQVSSGKHGATMAHLTKKLMESLMIPVPSLETQQEIVDKLDTFETLISNIKQEIELRQKQYEYYREKLLTFE